MAPMFTRLYSVKRRSVRSSTGGMIHKGYKIWKTPEGEFEVPAIDKGSLFESKAEAKRFINNWVKQGNPGMAKKTPTKTYNVFWSPTGQKIATVQAKNAKAAKSKAPVQYRKYKGEMYVEEIQSNPGSPSSGWIKVNAIRQLPSGDIQLALPKGTMTNPGKRKSLLKSVGKVFGKVIGAGKRVIGNPSEIVYEEGPYIIYETSKGYAIYKKGAAYGLDTKIAVVKSKGNAIEIVSKRLDRGK